MQINAEVVDIRSDSPLSEESFLVDTNVWYWMTYTRASSANFPPRYYQTNHYPSYIAQALSNDSKLFWCGLSLSELAHIIEKTENEIYLRTGGVLNGIKNYRQDPSERTSVVSQIEASWDQVKSMANSLPPVTLGETMTDGALNRLKAQNLDGYDIFILESLATTDIINVITDDSDYATVPGIKVFTANRRILDAAATAGKLVTR